MTRGPRARIGSIILALLVTAGCAASASASSRPGALSGFRSTSSTAGSTSTTVVAATTAALATTNARATTTARATSTTARAATTTVGATTTVRATSTTARAATTTVGATTTARASTTTALASTTTARATTTTAGAPWHSAVTATIFWVGEGASNDNGGIANAASAWDDDWLLHFGGVDDPLHRNGYAPQFTPHENPFYVALPYNDFDGNGTRKAEAASIVPWASTQKWTTTMSMLKNHWVEIRVGTTHVYAQWQDVGPYLETDKAYVFGTAQPANTTDTRAGIDLSPAVRDYLKVGDVSKVDWRFVDAASLPVGPWSTVVTTSQITWN